MKRTLNSNVAIAGVEKHFDTKQYTWHKYTSSRGTKLIGARDREVVLREGDLYGVKEYTTKDDMYLVLKEPSITFKVKIPSSEKIMNEKSKEYKGKTPTISTNPPTKIKVDLTPKDKKTVKEAATPKKVKIIIKLTANQKKIDKIRAEIKAVKKLKDNPSNQRKLKKLQAELKVLKAKEPKEVKPVKDSAAIKPMGVKQPAPTSAPVNPVRATKVGVEVIEESANKICGYIDGVQVVIADLTRGGWKVDYTKIGGKNIKVVGNASKTKQAIEKRLQSYSMKNKPANKIKIQITKPFVDDDDTEIPTGSVRYGGSIIEPDELEFDDGSDLFDIPVPESWSADQSKSEKK